MENTVPTPIDANIAPQADNAPPMATEIEPPTSITNGHTPPIGDAYGDGAVPTDLNASIEGKGDGKGSWTPGFRAQTSPERALKWDRYFTQPGQDAFDTIDWEMRSAGITGEDGKSVFEQTGCEIPKPWSQLATNVVVSKYFRGPINSPQRETSVKQVIGRVADTIGLWGAQGGYFASDEDTASFREELAYLLVHQYGAFNSPVWFNLGVKDARQQASACQPYDALVSTPTGLIPIGELVERDAVGQQVFTAKGIARILATKHNGRKEVLRLHLKSGYTLDVTADHLVWKARSDEGGKWVEAGTLEADDMLAWHRAPSADKSQELSVEVAEAALAGWLQSDGFVGRYTSGTNKSLTIEAMTVNVAEEQWVRAALDAVFPDAHSHTRTVVTQDENLDCQRIRIYGDFMAPFIEKWNLMPRGNAMTVPSMLYTAPLPVVVAYLRSLFQAEGYVSVRDNAVIAMDMVSEGIVRGVQSLLGRLGIYARVRFKQDARADRQGCWSLSIRPRGDRELFATEIGFIAPEKQDKVLASLKLNGHEVTARKTMQIERIEVRGEMDVYDIQTTSGEYLSNGLRVHNCFINDVYDDMESIMELAATEARLFKGGSGAGVNLWRVRSSKEQLRGGGIASGPISFMRGWDAFAGAVKSGGTTRRAAKMVILNADHPDIGEFITCKADEEKKAWALIEAGYNGGFNVPGGAYDSVAFQNANHSVRVTDEFMRAAENDGKWNLRAVTTGKTTDTVSARQMLKDIAQTTWICGDPGMQFDTIINDWHTCANTDRIYASNPCSEFMFLDSTACVTKETRVSTPEGLRKIADLYVAQQSGEQVYVTTEIAGEHDLRRLSAHRRAFVTQTGEREVFKISLADGRRIRATADHRFLTEGGWKRVDQLKVKGDRLQLRQSGNTVAFTSSEADVKRWQMLGWLTGDGVFSKDNIALVFGPDEAATARAMEDEFNHLISEARAYAGFEQEVAVAAGGERAVPTLPRGGSHVTHQSNGVMQINSKSQSLVKYLEEWYGFKQGTAVFKDVPSGLHEAPDDLKVAYLQGLFSADGCIRHDPRGRNVRAEEVMLASSSPELLRSVQLILGDLGLTSRIGWTHPAGRTNPQGQLHLYNQQGRNFMALIGFPCSPKKLEYARQITETFFDANIQRPRPATVIAIEPDGVEMVYDLTEPVTHSFIAEGIVTHNCNLASLNLLKFYNMETGEFDATAYSQACETFLTAQEIIVSFASYPTKKIGEMSEQYRPLGLGYANLGALLMAKGLAYDSDEGRALAGALTAIMTGAGYRKSAQIARNTGPFEGYAKNKEPMLRVIAKHRDAVNSIDATLVAENVMDEARRVWDDAYMTGQKYGYRNSQATVLAPTGCLVAGSLVSTDKGLVRLERLGNPDGAQWQDADFRVYTDGGVQSATKFFINGVEETRVITTQAGYSIQGTGKHRVKVVDAQTGVWQWKHFRDLEAGDLLPLAMNTLIGEAQTVTLPPLGQLHWNGEWNTRVPAQMTADLAELVGYFMGDGSLHAKGLRFCVAQGDDDVAARLSALGRELFGLEAHLTQQKGYVEVMLSSVSLAHWWDAAGFTKAAPNADHRGKGYVPRVPDAVLHSNDAHVYGAFLRGLFEADGTNTLGVPSVSTAHKSFADEIRSLLLALGFPTSSKIDTSQWGDSDLHVQRLRNGSYNPRWLSVIGFMGARKTAGVIELKGEMSGKGDRVFLPRAVWDELVPAGHPLRSAMVIALGRHGGVARGLASQIYAQTGDERVAHVLDYFFNEVESNEDGGAQMTYDLSVPANVTYVANGFVSHNTISFMMDCDTTGVEPDIALVKYKKLVGGGLLKIVNQTVPAALRNLGYDESEIKTIVEYIDKNDTIEGAPGLNDEHLPVFDCAFKAMNGTRSIHHMGHIKMMAATQPFISGAISKCVTGETLVATGKGIVPIGSFYRGEKPGEFTPVAAKLASIGAPQEADLFYYGGNRPTIKASWADGRTIEGTPNHRVKVANASGYDWKRLDALEAGDYVSVKLGANLWADEDANLLDGFEAAALYGCQKTITLPAKMTPDLARFLGMYIAEGNMTRTNYMVRVTNLNADVLSACERIVFETFGITGRVETDKRNGVTSWVCASKSLCEFLRHIGADGDSSSKQIPWSVLQSSEICVREFIGGLWLDGYIRGDGMTAICLNSPELLRQLQVVLNNFGLRAQLIRKYNKEYDKYFHELGLHGADSRRFSELFRLDDAHKTEALAKLCEVAKKVDAVHSDVIPAFRAEIQAFIRAKRETALFRNVFDARTKHLSRHTVVAVAAFYGEELFAAIPDLREILDNNIHFVALRATEEGFAPVYDFQVPTNHAFLGNGMINHNTVNMPQDCTADEIYDAYLQSWKMGVKAVAIYRDGSKRTQPLSTASDAQKAEKAGNIEKAGKEAEARKALRRKLPDERNSITHKFSIAGQEGYFMVGLYEDGSPGEIFIKMSKEGSTISGLMDSFAVAVSMCLQYGVPLRVLVNKFSHTRFEPSGYTTNRDIPIAKSLMDYIFRWFDLKFQPNGDNGYAGKTVDALNAATAPALPEASLFAPEESGQISGNHGNVGNAQREVSQMQQDAPPCPDCGALTVRSGACYKCNECGATTGCG